MKPRNIRIESIRRLYTRNRCARALLNHSARPSYSILPIVHGGEHTRGVQRRKRLFRLGQVVSPDGRLVATAGPEVRISAWGGPLNARVLEFTGRTPPAMAFSSDSGTLLVAGTYDNTLKFWGTLSYGLAQVYTNEVAGGAHYITTDGDDRITGRWTGATAVAFSAERQFFAYRRVDGSLVLARNPFGRPVQMCAMPEGNALRLSWGGGNRYYTLQRATNILSGQWDEIVGLTTLTSLLVRPGPEPEGFFRVKNLGN